MIYYGIVDKIDERKYGVYGANTNLIHKLNVGYNPVSYALQNSVGLFFPSLGLKEAAKEARGGLKFIYEAELPENKNCIIVDNKYLNNNYYIKEDLDLFYGIFDRKLLKNNAFKKIMLSYGGSCIKMYERSNLPTKLKHYGGSKAVFNTGLYCTHPKDSTILIPLNNSSNLIKTLILEETISAYEALGAKKMIIKDITSIKSNIGGGDSKIKTNLNGKFEKSILREKHFGKGVYDPSRAKESKVFIYDFPSIMTTINSRINGNQTIENFTENINLSIGLDVDILNLFQANSNFEYNRIWNFEVEFYDKNEL